MQNEVFAVIWCDACLGGMPLSLHCANAADAVSKAREMAQRPNVKPGSIEHLRAVHLPEGSDNLVTLWEA